MKYRDNPSFTSTFLIFGALAALVLVSIAGWVMNIYQVATFSGDMATPLFILKVAGVFLAPLGAVLGYF